MDFDGVRLSDQVAVAGFGASSVAGMFSIESSRRAGKLTAHGELEVARKRPEGDQRKILILLVYAGGVLFLTQN